MERKIIRIPVYIAFGLASFLIAVAVTFPDERIKEIAVVQMESQLGNEYDVTIEDLDLWWLTGVALEGITISERGSASDESADEDDEASEEQGDGEEAAAPESKPLRVEIPQVAGKFAPLSSLFNLAPTVDFSVDLGGGDVDGSYVHGSDKREIEVEIDEIDLKETKLISEFLGLPVFGQLDGDISIEMDAKRPVVTGGSIKLDGTQLTVGPGTITSKKFGAMGFVDVPQTSFGTLEADLNIRATKGGRDTELTFDTLSLKGRDIRGEVWGKIDLGRGLRGSRAKMEMRFQFNDQFIKKNTLQSVLNIKWLREGKSQDWYGFVLWGSLAKPNFKGAPTAAKGPPEGGQPDEGQPGAAPNKAGGK
ncbi:MAG: type II secretion system protein GspN [Myxococcota bacterium]